MPSKNSKYTEEMRERTVLHILNSGKSATSVAEELVIDTNTVCKWVRDYRRKNNLPSAMETKHIERVAKTIDPQAATDLQSVVIFGASKVLGDPFPKSFHSIKQFVMSVYESSKKRFVVLGLFRDQSLQVFEGDLTQKAFVLQADDELVLMRVSE